MLGCCGVSARTIQRYTRALLEDVPLLMFMIGRERGALYLGKDIRAPADPRIGFVPSTTIRVRKRGEYPCS